MKGLYYVIEFVLGVEMESSLAINGLIEQRKRDFNNDKQQQHVKYIYGPFLQFCLPAC